MIAGVGAGIYKDFNEALKIIRYGEGNTPDKENHRIYSEKLRIFADSYRALEPIYEVWS